SVLALRTRHPNEVLLDVFALRIAAAGDKFTKFPVPHNHIATALWAFFFKRYIRYLLVLIQAPRGAASRVSGASHELPEAPTLEYHRLSAVLAHIVEQVFIDAEFFVRLLLGEVAASLFLFVVRRAGIEPAMTSPA